MCLNSLTEAGTRAVQSSEVNMTMLRFICEVPFHGVSENIAQLFGNTETFPVDVNGFHYIAIIMPFRGGFPVHEHFNQIEQVESVDSVLVMFRMVRVHLIVMVKRNL